MSSRIRWLLLPLTVLGGLAIMALAMVVIVVFLAYPQLPGLDALTDYRPKVPLRVYSADGFLIGEFGDERRTVVPISQVPPNLKNAILAAEDERFYEHAGVDYVGVLRAALANLVSGGKRQGASTITMQVARNFFLTSEKTLSRKVYEALLAFKIEHNLTKDQILQLYINQIYLGQRAYGFASAAQTYFGKNLKDLSLAEAAMLAGLPKAPSAYNPVANPRRAKLRQQYVLRRMRETGSIDDAQFQAAVAEQLQVHRSSSSYAVDAAYVAEMARQITVERFGERAYTMGLKVHTTVTRADQAAANEALDQGVLDYDRRHGYRGAEAYVDLRDVRGDQDEALDDLLQDFPDSASLAAGIVLDAGPDSLRVYVRGGETVTLKGDALRFARPMLDKKAPPNRRLRRGAVVRLLPGEKRGQWRISQLPEVQAAFVSVDSRTGAVRALVGGFDFHRNKFNHVTQAWRQPGSSFKPFIYSAALEKGYSPGSVVEDEPLVVSAEETGSQAWEPRNYDGKYEGPMTLRQGLAKSKNMVSIRLLQSIGPRYAQDYVSRFGFDPNRHPPYLTMALGAGAASPWQMVRAYATFANGGYRVEPYVVSEITDNAGQALARFESRKAGDEGLRVVDPRNAYLVNSMLQDVVRYGTATRARALKRNDLAGKTGTTNDYVDAWFCGYQPGLVGIAWIGFDQPRKLGAGETGGAAALPIWVNYMRKALDGVPEQPMPMPDGLVSVVTRDWLTGEEHADLMYQEHVPPPEPVMEGPGGTAPHPVVPWFPRGN